MSMNDLQSFLQSMDVPHNYIRSKTKQIQIRIYCITPKDKEYLQINMKRQTTQYKRCIKTSTGNSKKKIPKESSGKCKLNNQNGKKENDRKYPKLANHEEELEFYAEASRKL